MPIISRESTLFASVEYSLRLHLHSSTANVLKIEEIVSPLVNAQFEKRSKNLLQVDSWFDCETFDSSLNENEVKANGFKSIHSSGFKFPVGAIKLNSASKKHRFMMCKIAIGHSFCSTDDYAKMSHVPEGYDSFSVSVANDKGDKIEIDRELSMKNEKYQYHYVIKDSSQILPLYIVEFEYSEEDEKKSRMKITCDNCESSPAAVFCQADAANLCKSCDKSMHTGKLASRHNRMPLDKGPQSFSTCKTHVEKLVEFYCPTCNIPVCVNCKMIGHHSTGDSSRHKLVTVLEAFQSVVDNCKDDNSLAMARKAKIEKQYSLILESAKKIEQNSLAVAKHLEDIYHKALSDLKFITKRKINILKGDVMELERQQNEISAVEEFFNYEKTGTNAIQFILDWSHYLKMKEELHNFSHFKESIDVSPDIKISGAIQVCTENSSFENLTDDAYSKNYEFKPKAPPKVRGMSNQNLDDHSRSRKLPVNFEAKKVGNIADS